MTIVLRLPGLFTGTGLPSLGELGYVDTFTRADASTLGSTESPVRLWEVLPAATVTGITGGEAYAARSGTLGPTLAIADAYAADCTITVTLGAFSSAQSGVTFRASSISDYWRFTQVNGAAYRLEKIVGTATTVVQTTSAAVPKTGDVLAVVLAGTSITCKVNGQTVITATDAHNQTVTKHGFYNNGSTSNLIRDVTVTAA